MTNLDIITGQFVKIDKPLANVGARFVSQLIDNILVYLYEVCIATQISPTMWNLNSTAVILIGVFFFVLPPILYFVLAEFLNNGKTLGKSVMGIRVVTKEGSPPSFMQALTRFLFLTFELTTGFGLVVMLYSKYNQRLGDMAAGTYVIKTRSALTLNPKSYLKTNYPPGYVVTYPQAENLSQRQLDLIQEVRSLQMNSDTDKLSKMLCDKICKTLKINVSGVTPMNFLQTITNDYYYLMSV